MCVRCVLMGVHGACSSVIARRIRLTSCATPYLCVQLDVVKPRYALEPQEMISVGNANLKLAAAKKKKSLWSAALAHYGRGIDYFNGVPEAGMPAAEYEKTVNAVRPSTPRHDVLRGDCPIRCRCGRVTLAPCSWGGHATRCWSART